MSWIEPDWPAPNNVHAAVTLRSGGVSLGDFTSLNPADHVNDDHMFVIENRNIITNMLKLPNQPCWLEQVHGNRVVKVSKDSILEQADASYTDEVGTVCVILTADCLPILLTSTDGKTIAVIHAGWRGLLAGVIENTCKAMASNSLIAWLGPAIGADRFQVGSEVRAAFIKKSSLFDFAFVPQSSDKYLANIYHLARTELATMGIHQVFGGDFCTVTDKQRFFSYRRDGETGRMATLIWRD